MRAAIAVLMVWLCAGVAQAAGAVDNPLVHAMRAELERSKGLSMPGVQKPYHLAYLALDLDAVYVEARYGKLVQRDSDRDRRLLVAVRVGSADLDNTNFLGSSFETLFGARSVAMPIEDDRDALARAIWIATDRAYKRAAEALEGKRAAKTRLTDAPDRAGDFSPAPVERLVFDEPTPAPDVDRFALLAERVSAVFRSFPAVQSDTVRVWAWRARRYFLSSEGALGYEPQVLVRLEIGCESQADDGMEIERHVSFAAASLDGLPPEAVLVEAARTVAVEVTRTRQAPVAEAFTGPVLLEGAAAAQLVGRHLANELSGTPAPAVSSPRLARFFESLGASEFGGMVGRRILPAGFRVEDLPSRSTLGSLSLAAGYRMDDEGVRAQDVVLVDDGKLVRFVMSRTPRKGVAQSNGHARADAFGGARGLVSNLVVTAKRGLSDRALRARLVAEINKSGAPYGLIVGRLGHASFGIERMPTPGATAALAASRISPDGSEQPVRGAELGDLSLRTLKDILAAGDTHSVVSDFGSGVFGDPWRGVHYGPPRCIAAPALLLREVRVKRPSGARRKPPLIPRPGH